jgi:FkbH-like protein
MNKQKFDKEIKCVVWDLDNTIWDGTLIESDNVTLKPRIKDIIVELDAKGILHSIASKNNYEDAMAKLQEFGLDQYFLFPEIHWNAKSDSIKKIQESLNIGIDTILFIDDQAFEREEVSCYYPEVEVVDASEYLEIPAYKRLIPKFITADSMRRRMMYFEDMKRNKEEEEYRGPKEKFLATLNMEFIISEAQEEDLKRAEELTIRTNQLNATGRTYSYQELHAFMQSDKHKLYTCELTDKYGSYGKIGLALVEINDTHWCLNLLLMSCRVMSRSVGSVLLTYIMLQTKEAGKLLLADFKQTERNKTMYVTYRFANFREITNDGNGNIKFENDLSQIQKLPPYISIKYPEMIDYKNELL